MRIVKGFAIVAVFGLAGCTAQQQVSSNTAQVPAASEAPVASDQVVEEAVSAGEPFSLYVHCGGREANFQGRDWVAVTALPELTPVRTSGFSETVNSIDGSMIMAGDDLLTFTVADARFAEADATVNFVPAEHAPTSRCE
ncbi:hypothetical protein GCU67_20250 [Modestobacter muralis]|uniref:Lipoprotein n=1 Tax=Modestobacter muralis TaxID=1608614 RepID=A0A6P0HC32_9ACTN|nr:hypothetical protein [Modestobacter muralis]NEK96481.1 hypothetical protein [Modestobacter muralis]NEN53381.1 hypothetical protein [Modestobacter muralis]